MIRNVLAVTGFVAIALVAGVAINAQNLTDAGSDRPPSLRVSFSDIDLATPAGRQALDRRIDGAVTRICGDRFDRDLHARLLAQKCRRDARRSTEVQVARATETAGQRNVASTSQASVLSSLVHGR